MLRKPKLTLSLDADVIARAKRYARAQSTSVSGLVERMLDLAAAPDDPAAADGHIPPVLARLRGSLKRARRDYHRYIEQKYR